MPPFSRPVARIKSDHAAPAKPWRLKIGAAWRMISRRVSAPLLVELLRMRQASLQDVRPTGLNTSIAHAKVATERSFCMSVSCGRFARLFRAVFSTTEERGLAAGHDERLVARNGVERCFIE